MRSVRLVLLLLVVFAAGCPGTDPANPCTGNADCANDERCVADLCEAVSCEPACGTGLECRHGACACISDDACPTGQECAADGSCVDVVPECTSDDTCGSGRVCTDGTCTDATTCTADADCTAESRVCEDGFCVAPCTADADCGSPAQLYACDSGHCLTRCLNDAGCPIETICEPYTQGSVCRDAECTTTPDCGASAVICTSANHGRCETITPCTADADCDFGFQCGLPSPCPPGYDCSAGNEYCVERPGCNTDIDCNDGEYCDQDYCFAGAACTVRTDCDPGLDCVGDICVPLVCRGAADCQAGEVCSGGECLTPGTPPAVDRVSILSPGGIILEGETRQLVALAYDTTGSAIVGADIQWSSSADSSVSVDATGVVTGGTAAGPATITATFGPESDSIVITLVEAPTDFRVTVVEEGTGLLVEGAFIEVVPPGGSTAGGTTGADGTLVVSGSMPAPFDVHVFSADHDYLSVYGVNGQDLLLVLPARSDSSMVAGLTGGMSYANVSTTGEVSVGLAGVSMGQSLPDVDLLSLMGDIFVVTLSFGGQGQDIPLPGGMTAEATFSGFPIRLKSTYYSRGKAGLRAAWAFAGKVSQDRFGNGGATANLASLLPLFSLFEHGLDPRVRLADAATIVDTADIDGDGDTTEMVPDWNAFPSRNMAPAQVQTLRLNVDPAPMPTLGGTATDAVILMAGARTGSLGLVPLGLSASELPDTGGNEAPAVTMKMTPIYGGLEAGNYQLLAMAVDTSSGAGSFTTPREASVRVVTTANLPQNIALDPFLPFPEATSFDDGTRTVTAESVAGASMMRVVVEATGGAWHVLGPAAGGSWVLPAPPSGMDDLAGTGAVTISPIELQSGLDYEMLLSPSGASLLALDEVTAAYSKLVR